MGPVHLQSALDRFLTVGTVSTDFHPSSKYLWMIPSVLWTGACKLQLIGEQSPPFGVFSLLLSIDVYQLWDFREVS